MGEDHDTPDQTPPGQGRDETGEAVPSSVWGRAVLYPNVYVWYVLLASLDVMLTAVILAAGGYEMNLLADRVLHRWGLPGLVGFKFSLVLLVVAICEVVGRRNDRTGRKLAEWAVAITAIPVVVSLVQLLVLVHAIGL